MRLLLPALVSVAVSAFKCPVSGERRGVEEIPESGTAVDIPTSVFTGGRPEGLGHRYFTADWQI
jgi:hypothetical protein